jgi:hypothetical protein
VADDRFGDLGPKPPSAAERLQELDEADLEQHREEASRRPKPPRPRSRYGWVVGVACLIAIVAAGVNSIPRSGESVFGIQSGNELPEFAAPLASGTLEGDVNIKQSGSGKSSDNHTPACDVHQPGALNICEVEKRGPVVLTFVFLRAAKCEPQLDRIERLRRRFPDVQFVGVVSGEDRERVAGLAEKRGWGFPVAVDPDGALSNIYRVSGCPTTTFAYKGGKVYGTRLGSLSERDLEVSVRRIARGG